MTDTRRHDDAPGEAVRKIGLLLVHGVGEQEPLDHLKTSARELASYISATEGLIRLSVIEDLEVAQSILVDAVFERRDGETSRRRRVRIELKEVFWADLGIKGGLVEQLKFWLWGLGQWAAFAVRKGNPGRNTEKLMAMPAFAYQKDPMAQPGLIRQLPARFVLFVAGLLAFLTVFSWSVAKRFVAFLADRIPESSLIFLFLGDVKNYEQGGAAGKGSLADPDQPMRTTIRRRMVRKMVEVAAGDYDEWYLSAHSLGTIAAFNALQETELALPNYLSQAEWAALPTNLKTSAPFVPDPKKPPSTDAMMPRRPPWLQDHDGIDRVRLFQRFRGFVSYGSPLDKFAALWPRVVCLNLQTAVFPHGCEWINLHDPTDPVSAKLDAFAPPEARADEDSESRIALAPRNFATRASLIFGLSHIRYFLPRRRAEGTMAAAVVGAVVSGRSLADAAEGAKMSPASAWLRALAAMLQVALLTLLLAAASAALLIVLGKALPDAATTWLRETIAWLCPKLAEMLSGPLWIQLLASALIMLGLAVAATLLAGTARFLADAFKPKRR